MLRKSVFIVLVSGIVLLGVSCNNYSKILKSGNNELKYETGVDLYENGDFNRALQFFDILRAVNRGTEKGEKLTYYTANCYFQMNDYQIASYYYNQYVQMYSRSEFAQESAFMSAYCNYLESPRPSLDQTSTYTALKELQNFIDMYPRSDKVVEAHRLMDELRHKLEVKSYNVAQLYYRMGDYQAAITTFENVIDDYPDTDYKEELLYSIAKSYYAYAEKSVYRKKGERYEKTIEACNNLVYLYPESVYIEEINEINIDARNSLKSNNK